MIVSFRNRGTADIFSGTDSQAARNTCPPTAWPAALRRFAMLVQAERLVDLKKPYGNRLHALKRDRAGQHAIRINDTYRICFRWTDAGAEDVEITDYHH
ncbi:MAG: type II toxin-antitoxin system RelE/ParE family toxin [Longimicrobiaceae bacterium]